MFYVYQWYIVDTKEIFYVGKGCRDRVKTTSQRNKLFKEVLKNNKCDYKIVKYFKTEEEALKFEHNLICDLKSKNQCKCNLDDGGKGGMHFIWTNELRAYMSKYNGMKSENQRKRMSENNPMKNPDVSKKMADKIRKHPIIDGKYYNSVEEASLDLNVSVFTIRDWCKRGVNPQNIKCRWSCDPEKNITYYDESHCKKVIYKGIIYNSKKEFCSINKISKNTGYKWCKKGFDSQGNECRLLGDTNEYVFKRNMTSSKPIIIDGIRYPSVLEASRVLGIKETTLHYHIHNNTGRYNFKYDNQ